MFPGHDCFASEERDLGCNVRTIACSRAAVTYWISFYDIYVIDSHSLRM